MIKRLFLVILIVTGLALFITSCAPGTTAPTNKTSLKIGAIPLLINLPAHVAQQEGLFEQQSLTVEIVQFRSTAEQETALLTGDVDGIFQHIYTAIMLNKDGETAQLVGAGVMPGMYKVIASKESGITKAADLKGKEVALATNTSVDYALDQLLPLKGLGSNDITKVNVPSMPLRLEMLTQGKVPAAIISPPLSDVAILAGGVEIVDDMAKPLAGPGVIFSKSVIKNKSDAILRFIDAWQQAVESINANPEKYRSLLVEIARVPESVSESMPVPEFPELQLPAKEEVSSVIDWMIAKGLMSNQLEYMQVVNTKFVK